MATLTTFLYYNVSQDLFLLILVSVRPKKVIAITSTMHFIARKYSCIISCTLLFFLVAQTKGSSAGRGSFVCVSPESLHRKGKKYWALFETGRKDKSEPVFPEIFIVFFADAHETIETR